MQNACSAFSFQQLNVTFIQEMEYIAVDIPHFILVLFSLFVCSIQAPTIYEIVQVRSLEFIRLLINLVKDLGLFR